MSCCVGGKIGATETECGRNDPIASCSGGVHDVELTEFCFEEDEGLMVDFRGAGAAAGGGEGADGVGSIGFGGFIFCWDNVEAEAVAAADSAAALCAASCLSIKVFLLGGRPRFRLTGGAFGSGMLGRPLAGAVLLSMLTILGEKGGVSAAAAAAAFSVGFFRRYGRFNGRDSSTKKYDGLGFSGGGGESSGSAAYSPFFLFVVNVDGLSSV